MIQLKLDKTTQLLNKPNVNKVILRKKNIPLKSFQPLEMLRYFEEGLRSFHTSNIGSAGQRAAKLLDVKIRVIKKSLRSGPSRTTLVRPEFDSDRV